MIRWLDIGFREWVLPFDSAAARTCVQTAADHRLAGRSAKRTARSRHMLLPECCADHP